MSSSDIQYASWLVRAARAQRPSIEAKSDLTDADHDGFEGLDARQETRHSPNGGSIEGQNSDLVEDKLHEVDDKQPEPDCKEPRKQINATDNNHKHSRSELEGRIVTYQTEIAALESKFLTEYGLLEDETEELRTNNKVLRGDIAQASANVEGLKMQIEAAADAANGLKLGLLNKLESEQAEYNILEDDRDSLKEAMDTLSKDLDISKEGQDVLQKENVELKELLARHDGRRCWYASTNQSQAADRTIREEQGFGNVQMNHGGGERDSKSPVEPGNPTAIESRSPNVEGATNFSRSESNVGIRLCGHPSWTEQDDEGDENGISEQDHLVRLAGNCDPMTDDDCLEDHPLLNPHPLEMFQERVHEIQNALDKGKSSDSGLRAVASLSKLLADLDDLLHQMSYSNEDKSWNDDTLHDMPAHSTTDSVIGDVPNRDRHDAGDIDMSLEKQRDTQNLVGGSSLSDVVGWMNEGQTATPSNADAIGRGSPSPRSVAIADDKRSIGSPKAPGAMTKSSKMRRWSSQSKAFLAGLHRPHASIDRRECSLRTISPYSVPEESENRL